jgi:hypothetical protein
MQQFRCERISVINTKTGHCELTIQGIAGPVKGKISDPVLRQPKNIYTKALQEHVPLLISAKPVEKDGEIRRLYISDAHEYLRLYASR